MRFLSYLWLATLLGAAACTGSQTIAETDGPGISRATVAAPTVSLDLSAVIGRNIDQVRRTLGMPREAKAKTMGIEPTPEQMKATKGEDWINTFEKNGTTVVATFNARTRQVRDLVVVGDDEDELLGRTNLSLTSPNYMIVPVANPKNARAMIGLRVMARGGGQ